MGLFDNVSPQQWDDLSNFGFATMAAGGRGDSTLGAIGEGGLAMNQAALQRAQTQNIQAEAQGKQLQNQLIPYNLQYAKLKNQYLQNEMGNDNSQNTNLPSGTIATMPYSPNAGSASHLPTTSYRPVNSSGADNQLQATGSNVLPNGQADNAETIFGDNQGNDIPQSPIDVRQRNARQDINTNIQPDIYQQSSGATPQEQAQLDALSKKIDVKNMMGLPTAPLEANVKRIQDTIAARDKANIEAGIAAKKASQTKSGENAGEAKKTLAAINSGIDSQINNLISLKQLSDQMPFGKAADIEVDLSRNIGARLGGGSYDKAWTDFNTMNKQMFVNGLMGSIPAGSRLDIPIVKALQAAKEVDPYASPAAREAVITRHIHTLLQAKQNAAKNYELLGGQSAGNTTPPQYPIIPPKQAIQHLLSHPHLAKSFEDKYHLPASAFIGIQNGQ